MEKEKLKARHDQEVADMRLAGIEGPVQFETTTFPESKTLYFVEIMSSKSVFDKSCVKQNVEQNSENKSQV